MGEFFALLFLAIILKCLYGLIVTYPIRASIIICAFIITVIFFRKMQKEEKKIEQAARNQKKYELLLYHKNQSLVLAKKIYKNIVFLILQNLKTLDIKYRQNVFKDDYGNIINEAWLKEIDYFVSNVLLKKLPSLIENKNEAFVLLCADIRTIFTFPNKVNIDSIKQYTTCFEFLFIDKEGQPVKMTKKYIESHMDVLNLSDINSATKVVNDIEDIQENAKKYAKDRSADISINALNLLGNRDIFVVSYKLLTQKEVLRKVVEQVYQQVKDHIFSSVDSLNISEISPYDFERKCAEILRDLNYEANVTKGSGDQGVDVVAKKKDKIIAIQCKKYSQPVGNKAVQEVIAGKDYYGADFAVVVSNASFTPSARKLASKCNVILLDVNQLNLLDDYIDFS